MTAARAIAPSALAATLVLVAGCADRPGSDVAVAGAGATWR